MLITNQPTRCFFILAILTAMIYAACTGNAAKDKADEKRTGGIAEVLWQ